MKKKSQVKIEQLTKVMQEAISEDIERSRKLGYPIAIWKDGKVVVGKVEDLIHTSPKSKRHPWVKSKVKKTAN